MSLKMTLCTAVLLTIGTGVSGFAKASGEVRQTISTQSTYAAGSDEVDQIQGWLVNHASVVNGATIGDFGDLGNVTVAYKMHRAPDSHANVLTPRPPVPLPASGNPGEEISITSTTQSSVQTWSYRWVNVDWVLIGYSYDVVTVPR